MDTTPQIEDLQKEDVLKNYKDSTTETIPLFPGAWGWK